MGLRGTSAEPEIQSWSETIEGAISSSLQFCYKFEMKSVLWSNRTWKSTNRFPNRSANPWADKIMGLFTAHYIQNMSPTFYPHLRFYDREVYKKSYAHQNHDHNELKRLRNKGLCSPESRLKWAHTTLKQWVRGGRTGLICNQNEHLQLRNTKEFQLQPP